jgi:acetolactate synthase-1/3 small subunit
MSEKQHVIISILVSNHFGVLMRISSLFTRRGYNIDSLTVGETSNPEFSRMTITMTGEEYSRDQIVKQLKKIPDVSEVVEMSNETIVSRELMLIKVKTTNETRQEIMDAINVFRNKIIDYSPTVLSIEMTGESTKLDAFVELMEQYGIVELCRTGKVSMHRGLKTLK